MVKMEAETEIRVGERGWIFIISYFPTKKYSQATIGLQYIYIAF